MTNFTTEPADLADVQGSTDERNIKIDKVGVKDIRYPIVVKDRSNQAQNTIGLINMYVELPHHFKGTHMSRFLEVLNQHLAVIAISTTRLRVPLFGDAVPVGNFENCLLKFAQTTHQKYSLIVAAAFRRRRRGVTGWCVRSSSKFSNASSVTRHFGRPP